jgi:hypothetical protein
MSFEVRSSFISNDVVVIPFIRPLESELPFRRLDQLSPAVDYIVIVVDVHVVILIIADEA